MYLNKYNYSTSFTDIVDKYKLPRHYLLKALTTGCPDDEYPEARKWNSDLQKILDKEQLTLDEFKDGEVRVVPVSEGFCVEIKIKNNV